ncbi:uncharacterized protein LOC115683628 isoform X3 [Syzygium oleosum]|uniref:uncharacterized protein LOC115683628 isoform X3 n=1 Tax=Syzygium oleosum TaxID=219896 RepID=UPI0024BB3508|nr:uncharacterized protein LOC115683628 isoform X3 [Syzygium oleosum]
MQRSQEASDLPSVGCRSAFWALLSLARGFIRQHAAWSRSSVMEDVFDHSFRPSNTGSGLDGSEPVAASVRSGQGGVLMRLPVGSLKPLQPDLISGLVHLHHLGIIHPDLKPQNVLITKELCAKLSDMGSSNHLLRDTSSSGYHVADCGSSGLQAPEQLCSVHQTCSVDAFGHNRVSFFGITGRRHPFGNSLKGDSKIEENTMDLSSVEFMPEAADLFDCLLHPHLHLSRPKALEHVYLEDEGRLGNCRSDDEGDPDLKVLSQRKKQGKSGKINQSLDNKDEHGSLENDDRMCDSRSYDDGDPSLKMPSKMKTHESIESDGNLNKKDEHVSSEIDGKLGTNRINDEGQSKMKVPCWRKKTHESGKRNENFDKKDEHVSSENEDRLGNSRSGDEGDFNSKTLSKREKRCKSGKSNGGVDRKEHHVFSENEGRLGNNVGNDDAWMNLKKPVGGGTPGCRIGKLFVSNTEIAKGSKGTIILEGFYEGRPVAVKRLVQAHHYVASQEIQSLTASDQDPNIVRLYGAENDQDFLYLALERCACSLDDLILAHSTSTEKFVFADDPASNATIKYKMRLDSVKGAMQDVNLWREDGHPSPLLLKLMRDVVSGLVHLHRLGIIHRDLKPQNVLITKELYAKLSDMGSSKPLRDTSSSGYHVADCGSSGLQAPEQIRSAQRTCSVDEFGHNRVSFFGITGRRHPFGDSLKGDSNIEENIMDLSSVEFMPEAADMFTCLLHPHPHLRPKALEHVYLEDEGRLGNCRSDDEGDPILKALSKRKKEGKSRKINQSLVNNEEHGSLENNDRICDSRSYNEGDPNLKMPSKMKTHESIESDGSLNKKDEHVSSEMDGKLGTSRINDEGQSKMKVPCWIKKIHESGKRNENLDKKDQHVSSENEDRFGNSRSGDEGDFNSKTLLKREKRCESGKSNGGVNRKEHHVFSENEGRLGYSVGIDDAWMNLKKPVGGGTPGCRIGKLFVSNTEIAKGSKGTIILEGFYEGRPVAVKRLVRALHYVASQEIRSLTASDRDPNIVRLYGAENDQDFVYLALERCACSLDDLIRAHSNSSKKSVFPNDPASNAIIEYKMRLDSVKGMMQDVNLWREDGHPSTLLLKLMRCRFLPVNEFFSLVISKFATQLLAPFDQNTELSFPHFCFKISPNSYLFFTVILTLFRVSLHFVLEKFLSLGASCQSMPSSRISVSSCWLFNYRDVSSGLVHLHCLGIIHRDLKPQSVLITKELCAKLSDMGSSKLLPGDTSALGNHVTDCGSPGLQTPEQLCPAHQACSVDVFGLGCILFFCVTGGRHPFGDNLKGDSNIKENTIDLSPVEFLPEAADLCTHLLNPNPILRPKAVEVLHHPLFWNSKMRLSFLRDVSDWVESKTRRTNPDLLEKLERIAQCVFDEEWYGKIDHKVIKHMRRFRAYNFKRVRDLLRIVRNIFSHSIGLPPKIQEIVGSSPEDLDSYIAKRFPRLLIETYRFISMCCKDEERSPFLEYFNT